MTSSTVKFTEICNGHLTAVIVNGRQVLVSRITEINKQRPGHYTGKAGDHDFHIEGGFAAGGGKNDWFVSCPTFWTGYISATSLVDAIKLIENA